MEENNKKLSFLNVWWIKSLLGFVVLLAIFCAGVCFGEHHMGMRGDMRGCGGRMFNNVTGLQNGAGNQLRKMDGTGLQQNNVVNKDNAVAPANGQTDNTQQPGGLNPGAETVPTVQ